MEERLEQYIRENRKNLDELNVPVELWKKIESDLNKTVFPKPKSRMIRLNLVLSVAASVLIVLCASAWFFQFRENTASDLSMIDPELAKQQVHYSSLIAEKRSELKQMETTEPLLYQDFSIEFQKIDNNYQKLREELPTSPNQEKTVKAMIVNLQAQTEILSQQLKIIQQIKQVKKQQNNETQQI